MVFMFCPINNQLAGTGNFSLHQHVQTGYGAHPASYPVGTRDSSLEVKQPGCGADNHLQLVPRSIMCGTIPSLPQYAFMAWCSAKK